MKALELYVVAVVHLGLIPAVGYPLAWHIKGTWRDNRVGRALMHKAIALAALFVVSVLSLWVTGLWFAIPYALTVTAVVWTMFRQFVVLLSVLREERRSHDPA